ncbi:MAG: serine/threonine protein phosphatase 1 [Candidatus Paceibacteria bacterium]|jgi:serine/threonine protein phosphatase 1
MATWIVGDIHGCAEELADLVDRLALGPDDQLLSCGDLFHRGPDPIGVIDVLESAGAQFILGNHERAVLARVGLDPRRVDGSDRAESKVRFEDMLVEDLAGDGRRRCEVSQADVSRIMKFLTTHSGYALSDDTVQGAGKTPTGDPWWLVHAGVEPGRPLFDQRIDVLSSVRRLDRPGRPYWYEVWRGPALVLFGHTPGRIPRANRAGGRLVSLGLDTACVYGGRLTAYSPELDEVMAVPARRKWVVQA